MEELKLHYLKSLLVRKETSAERYIIAMRELEEKTRKCYAEPISLISDEFVHMMLLDGCFIIELFLKLSDKITKDENDPIFRTEWMIHWLMLDLILFENQLPFFVLLKLYDLIYGRKLEEFVEIVLVLFDPLFEGLGEPRYDMDSPHAFQHLLDLLHSSRCSPTIRIETRNGSDWKSMQCTSQLQKAGIKFKKAENSNLFDITLSNGTMTIPHLTIEDRTESLFRNLIAHEQYGGVRDKGSIVCYITDYCSFMDYLIDSPEDLGLLCQEGIVTNWLGADALAGTMFNKLCYNVTINDNLSRYGKILNDVNTHCRKRRNRWMAALRRDYFNSPWAIFSFVGALLLLLLNILQAVFSVLSFVVHKS